MNAEEIREYGLSKKAVEESFPFDNEVLVFKVAGKIFLLVNLNSSPLRFSAKCMPDKAIELRANYSTVLPGYHLNKQHWNTIISDGSLPKKLMQGWIDDSYDLVRNSLPKKTKLELGL